MQNLKQNFKHQLKRVKQGQNSVKGKIDVIHEKKKELQRKRRDHKTILNYNSHFLKSLV